MDENEQKALGAELEIITKKYGITAASFTGTHADESYIGVMIGMQTITGMFETALNIGRFWQHIRGQIRNVLDEFEKRQ